MISWAIEMNSHISTLSFVFDQYNVTSRELKLQRF
jgi:hypothetical protein